MTASCVLQDGPGPGLGTVREKDGRGWLQVRWDWGLLSCYCMGAHGLYELQPAWL